MDRYWDLDDRLSTSLKSNRRFQEIDALRGVAIIMMVIFHFLFDLNFFGVAKFSLYDGFLLIFQRTTITLFLLLVGVSLTISYAHEKDKHFMKIYKKFGKRSLHLFFVALAIMAGTWVFLNGNGFVAFGIINLISVAIILAAFFITFYYLNLLLGVAVIAIGFFIDKIDFSWLPQWLLPLLLPLGIIPDGYYSVDFVPIFPYFGIVLIGLFLGKYFYPEGKRRFKIDDKINNNQNWISSKLVFLGRNSLILYLIHQPILIGLLLAYLQVF